MKISLQYQCSICGKNHSKFMDAYRCEKRSQPNISDFPIGLMHEFHMHGKFVGIFAIAETFVWKDNKHHVHTANWAIRRTENLGTAKYWEKRGRDCNTLDPERCGGEFVSTISHYKEWHHITKWGREQEEFKKMCEYLYSKGINPRYYDEYGTLHVLEK